MDLRRVPVSVLVALGLSGCGPDVDDKESSGSASASTSGSTTEPTVGPCLSPPGTCLSSTGPCLKFDVPPETTGPETTTMGTDGTGTGGTGTEGDTTTTGPCLDPPPDAAPSLPSAEQRQSGATDVPSRAEVLERLGAALPADVLARLAKNEK